jgi:hypothetical protein
MFDGAVFSPEQEERIRQIIAETVQVGGQFRPVTISATPIKPPELDVEAMAYRVAEVIRRRTRQSSQP